MNRDEIIARQVEANRHLGAVALQHHLMAAFNIVVPVGQLKDMLAAERAEAHIPVAHVESPQGKRIAVTDLDSLIAHALRGGFDARKIF